MRNIYLGSGPSGRECESYEGELHAEESLAFNDGCVFAVKVLSVNLKRMTIHWMLIERKPEVVKRAD